MCDPFSLITGVLSVVDLVLQVASGAMGMVDKTVTAHASQKRVVRNLRRELEKTIDGTASMQIILNTMLGNSKDKIVKKCAESELYSRLLR
jgi:C4-type Zn-finger protein